jgi:septal ring factor EnvC (AmiA/AmiB activator)
MISLVHRLRNLHSSTTLPVRGQLTKRFFASESGTHETGGLFGNTPWDVNNRIRVIASAIGSVSFVGFLFDTFYNRATKQELKESEGRLETKIEALDKKVEAKFDALGSKIDNLAIALLGVEQKEKISFREENTQLKLQINALQERIDRPSH